MSVDPVTRRALRAAEDEAQADASRLVAAVPRLMQEAGRRRRELSEPARSVPQIASWALPRLAAVTAIAVLAAGWVITRERGKAAPSSDPTTLESVIMGKDGAGTGDVVFDALLKIERSDG